MKCLPTEDQFINIILPVMQVTAQQYVMSASELLDPPGFIALMLRYIADNIEENVLHRKKVVSIVKSASNNLQIKS